MIHGSTALTSAGAGGFDPPAAHVSVVDATLQLLRDPLWMSLVLALSCLFFVVTGVQFWATTYLEEYADKKVVNPVFVAVAGTGPTAGVIAGGAIYDKRGGYSTPAGRYACLKVCCSSAPSLWRGRSSRPSPR